MKKLLLRIRLWLLRIARPDKVMYIGGSDTLPQPLSRTEEARLIAQMGQGDFSVRQTLIERNLRLVVYLARRFDFVFADCFTDNPASRRIIEKNGYRYLENYRMCFDALGEEKNVECFVHPGKQPLR